MGDDLTIYDGPNLQSPSISKLDNRNKLPGDHLIYGATKSFSSSGNSMLVHFVTDNFDTFNGFSAKIFKIPIKPICKDWLNITSGFLTSQDHQTMNCSWVITASVGSTILIQFHLFEVK